MTEQGISRDGIRTGFVPTLEALLNVNYPDIDIIKRGYGSTCFDTVGFLYLQDVIALNPDIVILEWHTTWLGKFNEQKYATVINSLLEKNIKVVNLVLPRKDFILSERDCVKQSRGCIKHGVFYLNLIDKVDVDLDLDKCLRDNVHTTKYGAEKYAQYIYDFLIDTVFTNNSQSLEKNNDVIDLLENYEEIFLSSNHFNGNLNYTNQLNITFKLPTEKQSLQLYAHMRVGPFSPKIKLDGASLSTNSIWDEWCGYERNCLKSLGPKFYPKSKTLIISIAEVLPEYKKSKYDFSGKTIKQLHCSFVGKIYCIGAIITNVELINKEVKVLNKLTEV